MRLLVTGASGQLGGYLLRQLHGGKASVTAWSHAHGGDLFGFPLQAIDLAQRDETANAFRAAKPEVVLHCGAYSAVVDCHRNPQLAEQVNTHGTALLAELAAETGARLIYTSTDMVFDGQRGHYGERDAVAPLSVYGKSKLAGESAVLAAPGGVVARISLMFGPTIIGRPYFFDQQLAKMRDGHVVSWFEDEWRSPIALAAAALALLALAESDSTGLIHIGGPERMSRFDMGRRLAAFYHLDPGRAVPVSQRSVPTPEPRPRDVSLDSTLWRSLFPMQWWPTWEEALEK